MSTCVCIHLQLVAEAVRDGFHAYCRHCPTHDTFEWVTEDGSDFDEDTYREDGWSAITDYDTPLAF